MTTREQLRKFLTEKSKESSVILLSDLMHIVEDADDSIEPKEICEILGGFVYHDKITATRESLNLLNIKKSGEHEVVEVCPHCDREVVLYWNVEEDGYEINCPYCGKKMMLCSECQARNSCCNWNGNFGCYQKKGGLPLHGDIIKNSVGTLLIEGPNAEEREDPDRIKIYDSNGKYLSYFSAESMFLRSAVSGKLLDEIYQDLKTQLKSARTINGLLCFLGVRYEFCSSSLKEFEQKLREFGFEKFNIMKEINDNELINQIGEYYILVKE